MNIKNQKITYSCVSDTGSFRKNNQDNLLYDGNYLNYKTQEKRFSFADTTEYQDFQMFGVFDGMGGEESGEVAAYLAAEEAALLKLSDEPDKDLRNLCIRTNRKVCQYAEENDILSMGTTAAYLAFSGTSVCLCNIGDSKIFCFDGRSLKQLSQDHLALAPAGVKRPLAQNIGIPEDVMIIRPYIKQLRYNPGDEYIICSDGLTDMVDLEEMWKLVTKYDIMELSEKLTEKALRNGGRDNITVISLKLE